MNGWNLSQKRKSASCLVYQLKINDYNVSKKCFGNIDFWMIDIPSKCNGYLSLKDIKRIFYYNSPNNFDIVYDEITNKIGFGKKWDNFNDYTYSNNYDNDKPTTNSLPYSRNFTLCLETSSVDAFNIIDTSIFIESDDNYYIKDGVTKIADICQLIEDDNDNDYGYSSQQQGYSNSDSMDNDINTIWSKPDLIITDPQHQCPMEHTNWNLKYKRSYVARKKYGDHSDYYYGNHDHRRRGWWCRKRRRLGYKHKFQPSDEEFYEDYNISDEIIDEWNENENVLSSCFVYELECSFDSSVCFGDPSTISSFIIDIPFECQNSDNNDVSLPVINHAFYWSEPDNFNVRYDQITHGLGFGLSLNDDTINLGETKEFTLCFERNQLNAYKMVLSSWKVQGNNNYYSVDGKVYVPDICSLNN